MARVIRDGNLIARQADLVLIQKLIGNGLEFDGVNDDVEVPLDASFNFKFPDSFSVECWFVYQNTNATPIAGTNQQATQDGWFLRANLPQRMQFGHLEGTGNVRFVNIDDYDNIPGVQPGDLIQLVAVADGPDPNDWHMYVNKVDRANLRQVFGTMTGPTNTDPLRIGVWGLGSAPVYFNERMYRLRIFNKAVSQSEVDELYDSQQVPSTAKSSVVLDYEFNKRQGDTVLDLSGNNNHGTLNGFSSTKTNYGGGAWRNSEGGVAK